MYYGKYMCNFSYLGSEDEDGGGGSKVLSSSRGKKEKIIFSVI